MVAILSTGRCMNECHESTKDDNEPTIIEKKHRMYIPLGIVYTENATPQPHKSRTIIDAI